ncbi:RNA polymerase sigma factor [Sphingosinicella sp. BN140058]|uniref:RNA polymerase sigma factor n=1 Tax=Sphingosinicella sp. BN140058 TaxID=1892855 RepID=UPI001010251E|nr:RNA polymerase sigma factor [Sphingosinicella sp. BN140058]QAY75292.1 RNA polymerase sigma factor [Sphingosinicella sp. BN140058]
MTLDPRSLDTILSGARPQAIAALLRTFRDLEQAEEAFQNACLRALRAWPDKGLPRNPLAWLILVGRNSGIDAIRAASRYQALPDEIAPSDEDAETEIAEQLDRGHYPDDLLRLLFICCHPDLAPAQQIALALRVVSGISLPRIARAFLIGDAAMEQRITRAKRVVSRAGVAFEPPSPIARAERIGSVAAMLYLLFNEGYTASENVSAREPLCDEAIRLSRLLTAMFPNEPELGALTALMLLQHGRRAARFDADGAPILLEHQDRSRWDRPMIDEGLVLLAQAFRTARPGRYQIEAAIAALHSRARRFEDTDWPQIAALYEKLELFAPSPVVQLNRAAALSMAEGPAPALALVEPLEPALTGYFYFHGLRGHLLQRLGRDAEARQAFDRAIGLANTAAEAAQIRLYLDALSKPC